MQVYTPHSKKKMNEMEKLYQQISDTLKTTKKHDIDIIMGDFNAKAGEEETEG